MVKKFEITLGVTTVEKTVLAEPSCQIGIIDITTIMHECRQVKRFQDELNATGRELNRQMEAHKAQLNSGQLQKRKEEMYSQFMRAKQEMEANIEQRIQQAMAKVADEKKLMVILYKSSVAFGGIDVTMEVMNKMQ